MQCPGCQHENREGRRYCAECGASLALACPSCGFSNEPGEKFCGGCGAPLGASAGAATGSRFSSPETYTPKHLAEKILTSKAALEGERKQVTVLFADLKGSMELLADRDPEEARKILDPVLEHMMEAVHRYEGTVNQVMGDGIMALFGAPLAHEDHAVRACYAALRMQESVKKYAEEVRRSHAAGVKIRVGLNSGEVVVRAIGSDLRMDYTAVGQTTHLAARMEQLADPGAIVITPDTMALAEGFVAVKSLGPVPVKGLAEAVEVYEVTGAGPARTRLQVAAGRGLTRFLGRDVEVEQLRCAQQLAGEGHGQVAAVVGEAGVGKSRLVYEFTHSHRLQGWLVLESTSVSHGKATSYVPVIDLLKSYFKIQDRDELREIRAKVTGTVLTLDESLKPTLPPLLTLLDVPVDDTAWQTLDPGQRRQRTLDAVKLLLLREARERPLVLIFEDLHWIDPETQALLDGLADSLGSARLLLLVNYRPEYTPRWSKKTYFSQLRLDALPAESAGELLDALLGEDLGLAPLKQLLVKRGNPFFLEETVRTLVETKSLVGERGRYRLTQPVQAIQVPPTVHAMLAARIDRLSPEDKRLLQVASVFGKEVPFALLQAIAELPDGALRLGLEALQSTEFLYETKLYPDLEYSFKHALTHEVTYGSLLQQRRRELHARIVEAIERLHADRLAEHVGRLAHHAVRGEVWDRGVRYLHLAGQKAASRSAHQEAVACFDQALMALGHLPDTTAAQTEVVDLRLDLHSSLRTAGDLPRNREVLHEAERIAGILGDRRRLGLVLASLGNHYYETVQGERSVDYCERALDIARELGDPGLEALAMFHLGQNHFSLGNYARAIDLLERSVAVFEAGLARERHEWPFSAAIDVRLRPRSTAARAFLARAFVEVGEFRQAMIRAQEVIELSKASDAPLELSHGLFALGLARLRQGNLEQALAVLEQSFEVARTRMVAFAAPIAGAYLGYALACLGRGEEGLLLIERAEYEAQANGHSGMAMITHCMLAEAYFVHDRKEDAVATAREALVAVRGARRRGFEARLLRLLGDIGASCVGDVDDVEGHYRAALELAGELGMRPLVAHCHLGLGKLYRRTGKREQAQEHLTTATAMYREMDMRFWLEQAEAETREMK